MSNHEPFAASPSENQITSGKAALSGHRSNSHSYRMVRMELGFKMELGQGVKVAGKGIRNQLSVELGAGSGGQ